MSKKIFLSTIFVIFALQISTLAYTGQTEYAKQFIAKSEGQTWFLDEIERILNIESKTIEQVSSSNDFKNIKSLGLNGKSIEGVIPQSIKELTELEHIYLSNNKLSGAIPILPNVQTVDISNNNYSGSISSNLYNIPNLKTLKLNNNSFTGTIPTDILNSTLNVVDLSNNKLTGDITFGVNSDLEYLALSNNPFTSVDCNVLGYPKLKVLSLWSANAKFNDTIFTLSDLEILDMSNNKLEMKIDERLKDLTNLKAVSLANNNLYGTIPTQLTSLVKLKILDLSNNNLTGFLPNVMADKIYVQNNYLTGANLAKATENQGNFYDQGKNEQYQLQIKPKIQIFSDKTINLYDLLKNKSTKTNNIYSKKILQPNDYIVTCSNKDVEITSDINGIYVKSLADIDDTHITIEIKNNTGSAYSKTNIIVTTNRLPIQSGGGDFTEEEPEVNEVSNIGYINGYIDKTFKPARSVTRGEVAKIIIEALQIETTDVFYTSFTDVNQDLWSAKYIQKAYELGFIKGYTDGSFKPTQSITRAEFATILVRLETKQTDNVSTYFSDLKEGAWYYDNVLNASKYGYITGYTDGEFKAENSIIRAEIVVMTNRFLNQSGIEAQIDNPFTDVDPKYWAYNEILTAVKYEK